MLVSPISKMRPRPSSSLSLSLFLVLFVSFCIEAKPINVSPITATILQHGQAAAPPTPTPGPPSPQLPSTSTATTTATMMLKQEPGSLDATSIISPTATNSAYLHARTVILATATATATDSLSSSSSTTPSTTPTAAYTMSPSAIAAIILGSLGFVLFCGIVFAWRTRWGVFGRLRGGPVSSVPRAESRAAALQREWGKGSRLDLSECEIVLEDGDGRGKGGARSVVREEDDGDGESVVTALPRYRPSVFGNVVAWKAGWVSVRMGR